MADDRYSHDQSMMDDFEDQRLQALDSYQVFETKAEALFDGLTEWAAMLLSVPIALISFVGRAEVTFKSDYGYHVTALPRQQTFCDHAIEGDEILVVPDAKADPRFCNQALVTGDSQIRFYAAAPLITQDGFRIGTFSVADSEPRGDFGQRESATLHELARSVMRELEARRQVSNLEFQQELNAAIAEARDFQTALDMVLRRAGERLHACYCLVPQELEDDGYYSTIAGVAIAPQFTDLIAEVMARPAVEISRMERSLFLADEKVIDTGVITHQEMGQYSELANRFYTAGVRRQIAVPLRLGARRMVIQVGFGRRHVSRPDQDFLSDMVTKLVPLLLGRLREQEVKGRRQQTDYVKRAMRTLIGANQALVSATTEFELMQTICEIAVRQGGYLAAWVGFAEHGPDQNIRVVAKGGSNVETLGSVKLTWGDTAHGQGTSGTAIRENRVVVMENMTSDPRLNFFRTLPLVDGFGSCISVPLHDQDGQALGVFTLYSSVRDKTPRAGAFSFDREEEELLTELARDIVGGITIIRDRNARDEALEKQHASDMRFANLLASSPTILLGLDYNGGNWKNIDITPNFERILGYPVAEALDGAWWRKNIHPDDFPVARDVMLGAPRTGHTVNQYRLARKGGGYFWLHAEMMFEPAHGDQPDRMVGTLTDVTEKQEAQNQIHLLAYYDQLTGLPNRQLFQEQVLKTLVDANQGQYFCALLFIDLDRFKAINDAHGHFVGDQVLIVAGKRLRACIRETDLVARLGGDEFVVLLPKLGGSSEPATERARALAQKIAGTLDQEMRLGELRLQVTASIGVYVFTSQNNTLEQILQLADIAMYTAKSITKRRVYSPDNSNIAVFEASMQERVARYNAVQMELRQALAEQRLELWLQPQVDDNEQIVGAEALIRLRRVDGSLMKPADFITVAEETGLIVPVGEWIRAEACRLLTEIPSARLPRLSVNISAMEFRQPHIVENFLALINKTGVAPGRLTLEITESLLIDRVDETIAKLVSLIAVGVTISIDDFGTGYSSLGYLQRLPIREIKIDKRFVHEMLLDQRSADLTQTLIMLAKNFNFDVVAEGVETLAQADFLRRHGCRLMQGYLFGGPRPAHEFNTGLSPAPCLET